MRLILETTTLILLLSSILERFISQRVGLGVVHSLIIVLAVYDQRALSTSILEHLLVRWSQLLHGLLLGNTSSY